jgi:hypothetical protein
VLGFVHVVIEETELAAEDDGVESEPTIEGDVLEFDLTALDELRISCAVFQLSSRLHARS